MATTKMVALQGPVPPASRGRVVAAMAGLAGGGASVLLPHPGVGAGKEDL